MRLDRPQNGQSLVAALVAMALLFSLAGALAVGASTLLQGQGTYAKAFQQDYTAEGLVDAGAGYVAGHGYQADVNGYCPGTRTLTGLGLATAPVSLVCSEMSLDGTGTGPSIATARFTTSGGCATADLGAGATGRQWIWFSALQAQGAPPLTATIDSSPGGCPGGGGACPITVSKGGGTLQDVVQVVSTCTLGAGARFVHVDSASVRLVRRAAYASRVPFVDAPGSPAGVPGAPAAVVSAGFSGAAASDLAVANRGDQSVSIFLNPGLGAAWAVDATYGVGAGRFSFGQPVALAAGSFWGSGSGRDDLVVVNSDGTVVSLLNRGTGRSFLRRVSPSSIDGSPVAVVAGDFFGTGGGLDDIAILSGRPTRLTVFRNRGDGTFDLEGGVDIDLDPQLGSPRALLAGDFNGDGHTDLLVAARSRFGGGGQLQALLSAGPGSFGAGNQLAGPVHGAGRPVAFAPLGGAVALARTNPAGIDRLTIDAAGVIAAGQLQALAANPTGLSSADLDGDGRIDLVVTSGGSTATALLARGGGYQAVSVPVGGGAGAVAASPALDSTAPAQGGFFTGNQADGTVSIELWQPAHPWAMYLLTGSAPSARSRLAEGDVLVSYDGSTAARLTYEGALG